MSARLRRIAARAAEAHSAKDYALRNELCWLHDSLMLAWLRRHDEVAT